MYDQTDSYRESIDLLLLSVSLSLSQFSHKDKGPYLFKYTLLGNEITTEEFTVLAEVQCVCKTYHIYMCNY